jgi:hypothetical protein
VAATSLVKRRQRMLKPCVSLDIFLPAEAFGLWNRGAASTRPPQARSLPLDRGPGAGLRHVSMPVQRNACGSHTPVGSRVSIPRSAPAAIRGDTRLRLCHVRAFYLPNTCHSAWGLDADRHRKSLNELESVGSTFGADSQSAFVGRAEKDGFEVGHGAFRSEDGACFSSEHGGRDGGDLPSVPIRLRPTPATSWVLPLTGVELSIGRSSGVARDPEERAEGVERVEPPIEAEREHSLRYACKCLALTP